MFGVHSLSDGKYKIQFPVGSRGQRREEIIVDSIEAVHEAMNHHFAEGPRAMQHSRNAIEHCPLCAMGKEEPRLKLVQVDGPRLKVVSDE